MNSTRRIPLFVVGLVLAAGALWIWVTRQELPRVHLRGGGEFRVYRIVYGGADEQHLPGAPRLMVSAWTFLPMGLQKHIRRPSEGSRGLSPSSEKKVLSIFWAWIDPETGEPTVSPSGPVVMTMEDGEVRVLDTSFQFDADEGGSYRQIYIDDPPVESATLRFCVPVEDETADFRIRNPAFHKGS